MISVAVIDDQALMRDAFTMICDAQPDFEVVGSAADGRAAVELCQNTNPDIALMDIRMPDMDGIAATRSVTSNPSISTRVIVLTMFDLDEYVYEAVRAGASGFLLKDTPAAELIDAVRIIAKGEALLAPSITRQLMEEFARQPEPPAQPISLPTDLTEREHEALRFLARGLSNREIAAEMFIGEATAKTHVSRLLTKLADQGEPTLIGPDSGSADDDLPGNPTEYLLIVGPLNLPSHGAVHASEMYSRNVYNMLQLIMVNNEVMLDPEDEIIARCVLVHAGQVNHPNIATLLEAEAVPFGRSTHVAVELPDQNSGWLREEADMTEAARTAIAETTPGDVADQGSGPDADVAHNRVSVVGNEAEEVSGSGSVARQVGAPEPEELLDYAEDEQDLRDLATLDGAAPDGAAPGGADEPPRDELILIDGVGPALQERLYSFGYCQWQDLAGLDEDAIEKLTVQLELTDEVREQNWCGQARRLMEKQR